MGKSQSKNKKNKTEFKIVQNNISYNINLINNYIFKKIKIVISFELKKMFYIYEIYLDHCPEIGKIEDNSKIYEQLSQEIKNKILEIP